MPIPTVAISASDRQLLLEKLAAAASLAGHIWSEYAACEAALETGWLTSSSARQGCNLFGAKQHVHPIYKTANLPTREFLDGHWTVVEAGFIEFPNWEASFQDRMDTLRRLAPQYPHYAAAIAADDGETFIRQVSQSWSTDPNRAETVLSIHRAHFAQAVATVEVV